MTGMDDALVKAREHFSGLVVEQLERIERMKQAEEWVDYSALKPIIIGFCGGNGIGPFIANDTRHLLEQMLSGEIAAGRVEMRNVEGLTIENRFAHMKAIPDDVLAELRACHVILKGPTETPQLGDPRGNIESANVTMRRELDLFANVRPVKVPKLGIDWTFFRENTEGAYVLGSKGVEVGPDLALDFKVITSQGSERIIRLAFEFAKKNGYTRVTLVTKANVVKTTDGKFSAIGMRIATEYPGIECDEWYIDIMTAKLIDPARRSQFQVFALPNLYGDILTDEAAQIQGGVGTAGSANIGKRYAMFEAIHGSGTRMVKEGRAQYADPSSMMRATVQLLQHIGFPENAARLEKALDICQLHEKKYLATGKKDGATSAEYAAYVLETANAPDLDAKWQAYQK